MQDNKQSDKLPAITGESPLSAGEMLGRLKASARDHVMQEADGAVVLQDGALGSPRASRREDDVAHVCGACAAAHGRG